MDKKYMPKITADTIEQFIKISDQLKLLPDIILEQIQSAEHGLVGITCNVREYRKVDEPIYLPDYTRQISNFGDYVGCYSGEYFFKIKTSEKDKHFSYLFIKTDINPQTQDNGK